MVTVQRASLLLDVNSKQIGQLCRDWYAIVDVMDVRVGTPTAEMLDSATGITECASACVNARRWQKRQRRNGVDFAVASAKSSLRISASRGQQVTDVSAQALPEPLDLSRQMFPAPNSTE